MSNLAFRRGRGPVFPDLPPTLQPHAILAAAPPSDVLRTASLSGLIYLLLASGAVALASLGPKVALGPGLRPTPPWRPVEIDGTPRPRPAERQVSAANGTAGGGSVSTTTGLPTRVDPTEPPAGLPSVDRRLEIPGSGPLLPGPAVSAAGPVASGPAGSAVLDVSMTGLAVLHRVDPLYPDFARLARIQGRVVLAMTVDEQGAPYQVQVVEGHPALQEAALQAARQWRFEPARMEGRPVAASFRLTLNFRLR